MSGNVEAAGRLVMPQGSSLSQAIAMAGGKKILSGKVKFLRFDEEGQLDRRVFRHKTTNKFNSYRNPILQSGDIINIERSVIGYSTEILRQVATPITTSYGIYNLIN